jgi:hypothetical protein
MESRTMFDDDLADRIRPLLTWCKHVDEKAMYGEIGFLLPAAGLPTSGRMPSKSSSIRQGVNVASQPHQWPNLRGYYGKTAQLFLTRFFSNR